MATAVVWVDPGQLDRSFVGPVIDEQFLADLPPGVDPRGENEEFHTFVFDGLTFTEPVRFSFDEIVCRGGFRFLRSYARGMRSGRVSMLKPRAIVLISLVLAAAASRLVPHPWNLTSIAAVALFAGAHFKDRRLAFAVPLGALFLSDLVLGLYSGMAVVYVSFALIVEIGRWLRSRRQPVLIAAAALASSMLFFILTNFGVWVSGHLYPKTWAGLTTCYTAAVPFFRNSLEGDLLYTLILFGGFALMERRFQVLREPRAMSVLTVA